MKAIKHILVIMLALLACNSYGQYYTSKANECYKQKDYECARNYIDSAIVSNERFNSQTWQLRGLIYRKLEGSEIKDARNISIESFVQARNLDTAGVYEEQITNFLRNTIIRYYNDAVVALDNGMPDQSENAYVLYKGKYKKYISADYDFTKSDIEYYSALGGEYLKQAAGSQGEEKNKLISKGVHFYKMVLDQDSTIFQPNFNIGITFYNQGADLIMNMDPLTEIEEIPIIEEKAQNLFRKALPFLHRAYKLDKDRIDVIEAITGCYYGLQDNENYLEYQTILDKKNLPILLEKLKDNPTDKTVLRELIRIYRDTLKDEEKYKEYYERLERIESNE